MPGTIARMGWKQTEASRIWLRQHQTHFDVARFRAAQIPAQIDPRADIAIKDQQQLGACSGFSRSSLEQRLNDIVAGQATHDVFSAMFAYLENQKACGCFGSDDGATIAGSVQAATSTGICMDTLFPYTGAYTTSIPPAAINQAKSHLVKSHSVLQTYAAALQYLGSGGVIQIGIPVGNAFQGYTNGLLSLADVQADDANPEGGHALSVVGYLSQLANGRRVLIGLNSWGTSWGISGSFLIDPLAFDYWCSKLNSGDTEIIGMHTLQAFQNPINWNNLYTKKAA